MLSDRRQRVLAALIEEYVAHALPVGSNTLTRQYHLGVSSATVRNDLSALENEGYIEQPHTSAGRIPTNVGYRAFVDDLLEHELADDGAGDAELIHELQASATELDDLMTQTSQALTRLTDCLAVVLPPRALSLSIKQITFVALSDYVVMVVIVTETGQVLSRSVEVGQSLASHDLLTIQELFNTLFCEKTFLEIKDNITAEYLSYFSDPLVELLLHEVFACLQENEGSRIQPLGLSSLLTKPEFNRADAAIPFIKMLEDETVLMHLIDPGSDHEKTMVRIGQETSLQGMEGVSVVASHYGRGNAAGIVAVIGPTRMDYSTVIKAVRTARNALQSP